MSLHNGPSPSAVLKPHSPHCRRLSVDSPQSPQMSYFVPRTFPPPPLVHVPVEYIIDQLHNLAPHYWNRPETTDCTIIVPVPHLRGKSMRAPETPSFPPKTVPSVASRHDPAGLGRRVTEPTIHSTPRISLNLHIDYLCSQSTFLRGLFSGASPLDLINTTTNSPTKSNTQPRVPPTRFTVPTNRLPRLLPSSPAHPILLLPVPDPTSFHLLIHWIYFGRTDFIEDCLNRGVIQWEGIARNVEYLGFPVDIKVFLGRWYSDWLRFKKTSSFPARGTSPSDDRGTPMDVDPVDNEKSFRGRTTTSRPLSSHRYGGNP